MSRKWLAMVLVVSLLAAIGAACTKATPAPTTQAPAQTTTQAASPAAQPVKIKAVGAWAAEGSNVGMVEFIKRVNTLGKGELSIELKGGPEVIPMAEQIEAVRSGLIDMLHTTSAYYETIIPEVAAIMMARISPAEERKIGFFDYMNKLHAPQKIYYLGLVNAGVQYNIIVNKKIDNIRTDFKGGMLRSLPEYDPGCKALGADVTTVNYAELYSAMERNVIQGLAMPFPALRGMGLENITKYYITHGWATGTNAMIMNLNFWNNLPKKYQDILTQAIVSVENDSSSIWGPYLADTIKAFEAKGMKPLSFSEADAKWYVDLFYEKTWQVLMGMAPQRAPEIKKMLDDAAAASKK